MNAWAAAPVLLPLATLVLTTLARARPLLQRALSFAGGLALLGVALHLVAHAAADAPARLAFGNWPAPYGIAFVVDRTGAAFILVAALLGLLTLLFLAGDADPGPEPPLQLPLIHGLLAGVGGAFATADLFNLYVWFEVMLICTLGLFVAGNRVDQLDAAFKYLALNLLATLLLLAAIGLIYAATGHLNYAALAAAWPGLPEGQAMLLLALLCIAFLMKAGAFPLFAWLPATYHTLPGPVLALVGGLLTKVGVYALLRTLDGLFAPPPHLLIEALGWIAAATMLLGVLGAAYHWDLRRILAVHIVSQIGYILLGLTVGNVAGRAAALFYTVHIILVKANLFFLTALIWRIAGSYDLRRSGGLARRHPGLALLFGLSAMALVGLPPMSGFWAKLLVLREAFATGHTVWALMALAVSTLTLYSMLKIWLEAFWRPHPEPDWQPAPGRLWPAWTATGLLTGLILALSLYPQPVLVYLQAAAATLGGPP